MKITDRMRPRAFTLIELLVVVAIIALLISILLPSLKCARETARAAKCGVQLRGVGTGLQTYASENNSWFPGANTTGIVASAAKYSASKLRRDYVPVQNYDWMSPVLKYDTAFGANRAERFQTLINEYRCPTFDGVKIDYPYPPGLAASLDRTDFTDNIIETYAPLSYLMPIHFQFWGQDYLHRVLAKVPVDDAGHYTTVEAKVCNRGWEAFHEGAYTSRMDKIGPSARKIAAADGMRFLTANGEIDFDVSPEAGDFGSFTSSGAWWAGSTEYGVKNGTLNWDDTPTSQGANYPQAKGQNLVWSYRHGCTDRGQLTSSVRDNKGAINAMFFDGHVARLEDKASRNIEFWYPTGSIVKKLGEGLTDVPVGYEVP